MNSPFLTIIIFTLFSFKINCLYVFPFDSIFIKDETINTNDYHSNLI